MREAGESIAVENVRQNEIDTRKTMTVSPHARGSWTRKGDRSYRLDYC